MILFLTTQRGVFMNKHIITALSFLLLIISSVEARPYYNCSSFKNSSRSCFMEFNNLGQRGRCSVCRENRSCFMGLNNQRDRNFCKAYIEGRSCFMAMNNSNDRGWCQVIKEGKSCFMALNGKERERCEEGFRPPRLHRFWDN